MAWPGSVITRSISFGKAVVLETGADLSLRVVTKASRALVSRTEGFRMETLTYSVEVSAAGEEIVMDLPITNQAGWLDATTRTPIEVGPNQHSHLYSSTLTIFRDGSEVARYEFGPYPIPAGSGTIDADTMLIPSGTEQGVLIPFPDLWREILENASIALSGDGVPAGRVWTSGGPGVPPSFKAPTGSSTGSGRMAFWNATSKTWGTRPSGSDPVMFVSTNDKDATIPGSMATYDMWFRHPDALESL